jgi:3-oxoacyl-[acyl-carrier protein] reductase
MKTQMTESILQLGREVAGSEYEPLKQKLDAGGDGTEKAAQLITWLAEQKPERLSGKLVSAVWDNYKDVKQSSENSDHDLSDLWTLRRVDRALIEKILKHVQ